MVYQLHELIKVWADQPPAAGNYYKLIFYDETDAALECEGEVRHVKTYNYNHNINEIRFVVCRPDSEFFTVAVCFRFHSETGAGLGGFLEMRNLRNITLRCYSKYGKWYYSLLDTGCSTSVSLEEKHNIVMEDLLSSSRLCAMKNAAAYDD